MKIFVSHQRADSVLAAAVAARLKTHHGIDSYLDLIDPEGSKAGENLGEYIRLQLGKCTQLLAVVSANTKTSWWVPWEIGIATEKHQPIATYAGDNTTLPEYLKKWPYLRSLTDLDVYATVSKTTETSFVRRRAYKSEELAKAETTGDFYSTLRSRLGQ